jgi:penicillin-binding protein 2
MQNSVTNYFSRRSRADRSSQRVWEVDGQPNRRLAVLYVAMLLPLLAVVARLVHLQVFLPGAFISEWEWTTESFEPIPSRDGRILSADGTVLAHDSVHYGVWMHYRWLEEPADRQWLLRKALSKLERKDRRNREKIEAAQKQVLAERQAMWQRLSELSKLTPAELKDRRLQIQERIERIVASVEGRQVKRKAAQESGPVADTSLDDANWWQRTWQVVKTAVTTPPTRTRDEPVTIPEEQEYYLVCDDVPFQVAAQIETSSRQLPGLLVRIATDRVYPQHTLAAHVVGTRVPLDEAEWKKRAAQFPEGDPLDYRPGDRIGDTGIERSYDRRLHGLRGLRRIVRDRRGEVVVNEVVRAPREGEDVSISIHVPLQQKLEALVDVAVSPAPVRREKREGEESDSDEEQKALLHKPASAGGSLVVLDVQTGNVVAAVSAPRYDLNLLVHHDSDQWRRVNNDPRRPFFPRVTRMAIPPGSVFKPLSAIALIESGRFDPDKAVDCHGYLGDNPKKYRCYHSIVHGPTTLADALCRSCNVYFFSGADALGPHKLIDWAQRFGFGQPTGIDLPGESGGNLPVSLSRNSAGTNRQSTSHLGETRGLAIGQGQLTVTPIQIARLMAAIANGGYLVTPRLVIDEGAVDGDAASADQRPAIKPRRVPGFETSTLLPVREGLERVVSDPHGTGYKTVRMQEISIAGKTGTAETGGGRPDHAWFAGYVPADQPRYAFAIVLEHAGSGGKTAGPVAHDLVQIMLEEGLLHAAQITQHTPGRGEQGTKLE